MDEMGNRIGEPVLCPSRQLERKIITTAWVNLPKDCMGPDENLHFLIPPISAIPPVKIRL